MQVEERQQEEVEIAAEQQRNKDLNNPFESDQQAVSQNEGFYPDDISDVGSQQLAHLQPNRSNNDDRRKNHAFDHLINKHLHSEMNSARKSRSSFEIEDERLSVATLDAVHANKNKESHLTPRKEAVKKFDAESYRSRPIKEQATVNPEDWPLKHETLTKQCEG